MVGERRGRASRRAGAALMGVVLLGGVAAWLRVWFGEGDPATEARPTVSASVSAGSVGTAAPSRLLPDSVRTRLAPKPTVPPEGRKPTAAGAEAFVRYWLGLYSYTYNTNDQVPWMSVADDGCRFCKSVIDNSTKQVEAGMHTVGGHLRPQYVLAAPDWSADDAVVSADYVEEPASGVDSDGKVRWRNEGKPYGGMMVRLRFDIVRGWVVAAVDVETRVRDLGDLWGLDKETVVASGKGEPWCYHRRNLIR